MSLFGKLFGRLGGSEGSAAPELGEAVEYNGYTIRPACRQEGSQWLTAGVIAKEIGEQVKQHSFVRADWHANKEAAETCAIMKGKRIVDEQGDRMFRDE